MTRALLDINVLLALFDSDHVDHSLAHRWLAAEIGDGWASCPMTENGFVRIISQPRYPSPISPGRAIELLRRSQETTHHEHWPCDISIGDPRRLDRRRLHGPRQVTDAYLLALAVAHGGRFVTFDRTISISAVPDAVEDDLVVVH
ncbi:MAG: PIN domain-containing protein [Actinomycetota bacterium]|nr:PIN domain-containing protein [Actinomycetota bacterium]